MDAAPQRCAARHADYYSFRARKCKSQLRYEPNAEPGRNHSQNKVVVIDRMGDSRREARQSAGPLRKQPIIGLA